MQQFRNLLNFTNIKFRQGQPTSPRNEITLIRCKPIDCHRFPVLKNLFHRYIGRVWAPWSLNNKERGNWSKILWCRRLTRIKKWFWNRKKTRKLLNKSQAPLKRLRHSFRINSSNEWAESRASNKKKSLNSAKKKSKAPLRKSINP